MIMTPMDDEFFQHAFDPYVAGRCLLVVSVVQLLVAAENVPKDARSVISTILKDRGFPL